MPTPSEDEEKIVIHCYQESGVPKVRYSKVEDGEEITGLCRMESEGEGWYRYIFEDTTRIKFELIIDEETVNLVLWTGEYWYYEGLYDECPEIQDITPTSIPIPTDTPVNSVTPIPEPTMEPIVTEEADYSDDSEEADITVQPTKEPKKLKVVSLNLSHSGKKAHVGDKITMRAEAKGGSGTLKYQFCYKYKGQKVILRDYSTQNSVVFQPKKDGTYTLIVQVMDEKGQIAEKTEKSYKVLKKYAINTLKVSGKDKKLQIKVNTVGAEGTVKYKYVVKYKGKVVKKNNYGIKKK